MLPPAPANPLIAFAADRLIATGAFDEVAAAARAVQAQDATTTVLVFDAVTSELVDVDPRVARHAPALGAPDALEAPEGEDSPRGPGRPKLGVVAREVTLLPRHWDWLATQPGGASAALRRLVEQARSANVARDRVRSAQESAYRFMSAMLGNQPHFEEATRALFAGDRERFTALSDSWPADPRNHARRLVDAASPTGSAADA